MIDEGFINNETEYENLIHQMQTLESDPSNKAVSWLLNIDKDILDISIRAAEIANWLKQLK